MAEQSEDTAAALADDVDASSAPLPASIMLAAADDIEVLASLIEGSEQPIPAHTLARRLRRVAKRCEVAASLACARARRKEGAS